MKNSNNSNKLKTGINNAFHSQPCMDFFLADIHTSYDDYETSQSLINSNSK